MIKTQTRSRIAAAIASIAMLATVIGVGATSASAQVVRRVGRHTVVVRRPVVHHSYASIRAREARARIARERIARERRMAAMHHHGYRHH